MPRTHPISFWIAILLGLAWLVLGGAKSTLAGDAAEIGSRTTLTFGIALSALALLVSVLWAQEPGEPSGDDPKRLELRIPNRPEGVGEAIRCFTRFAQQNSIEDKARDQVCTALDEMLANVVMHAYEAGADRTIDVSFVLEGNRLSTTVEDSGPPFDPFQCTRPDTSLPVEERPVGGLGIHLVREIMDEVIYERRDSYNVSTMVKYLSSRPPHNLETSG